MYLPIGLPTCDFKVPSGFSNHVGCVLDQGSKDYISICKEFIMEQNKITC